MKYHIPYYYKNFLCLGGECPDTCCGGWKIAIDEESYRKYRNVAGAFGERLKRGIDPVMRAFRLNGRFCEFLNEQGLCDIFRELGKDGLCRACRDYPRHTEDYGTLREIMLSMSCPEAAHLILEDPSQGAGFERNADKADGGNGKQKAGSPADAEEARMLSWLLELREAMVCMVRDRSVEWNQRLAMLLAFAHDFQLHWNEIRDDGKGRQDERTRKLLHRLTRRYLSEHAAVDFAGKLAWCRDRGTERMIRIAAWMRQLQGLEPVLECWDSKQERVCRALYHRETPDSYEKLLRDFRREAASLEQAWENLVLYYLRTWLLGALYDNDVYGKVKMAVFSYEVVQEWCLFRYRATGKVTIEELAAACWRYSREIENSDDNLEELEQMLAENPLFHLKSMMTVVCGGH